MTPYYAEESAIIPARPEAVYAVLVDYRQAHPQILPAAFIDLTVEQGGHGAGTVFTTTLRVMGREVTYHMVASEPEPGRVLVEADPAAGVVTTFTLTPVNGGQQTDLQIATEFAPKPGLMGLGERLLNPPVTRRIYREELGKLAAYLQRPAAD
jgi:hypothetical protein